MSLHRRAAELLEDAMPFLDAAQKAQSELEKSPLFRLNEPGPEPLLCPELCSDVIRENLCALQECLYRLQKELNSDPPKRQTLP